MRTVETRLLTALRLYKTHELSFGKAAELAGISREAFLSKLDENSIDFIVYDSSELESELERFEKMVDVSDSFLPLPL